MELSKKTVLVMEVFIGLIVVLSVFYFALGGFYVTVLRPDYEPVAASVEAMQEVRDKVAEQDLQTYAAVVKTGTPAEVCRAATTVAEDYHRASRWDRYEEWKAVVRERCPAAY